MNKKLILLMLASAGMSATLGSAEEYYLIGAIDYASVEIENENFNPLVSQLKFGIKGTENKLLRDVGLELVVGQAVKDDELDGFNVDVTQHVGLYGTFTHSINKTDFSVNLGYAVTDLVTQSSYLNNEFTQTFEGLSYGIRFHQSIEMIPNFGWTIDCMRYYSKDSVKIDGCGVGVSYEF